MRVAATYTCFVVHQPLFCIPDWLQFMQKVVPFYSILHWKRIMSYGRVCRFYLQNMSAKLLGKTILMNLWEELFYQTLNMNVKFIYTCTLKVSALKKTLKHLFHSSISQKPGRIENKDCKVKAYCTDEMRSKKVKEVIFSA